MISVSFACNYTEPMACVRDTGCEFCLLGNYCCKSGMGNCSANCCASKFINTTCRYTLPKFIPYDCDDGIFSEFEIAVVAVFIIICMFCVLVCCQVIKYKREQRPIHNGYNQIQ